MELLVGDIEDVQELPLGQPALDVVKPGAVVHCGGDVGGVTEGPRGRVLGPQGPPQPLPVPSRNRVRKVSKEPGSGRNLAKRWKW